jgi:uncharacterized protein YjbI with pentapeptide repeats
LYGVYLETPLLKGAGFEGCDLRFANLEGADVAAAHFEGAQLTGTIMRCRRIEIATLIGAYFDEYTQWPDGFDPEKAGAVFVKKNLP